MYCDECPFKKRMMVNHYGKIADCCTHPNNYQPWRKQYMKSKPLSPRFYPKAPAWCKLQKEKKDEKIIYVVYRM